MHLCIDCRTALGDEKRCPGGEGHRVVDLRKPGGRDRLRTEVWGPPDARRQRRTLARAGGGGAGVGFLGDLANGCTGCDALDLGAGEGIVGAILVVLACALIAVVVGWLIIKLVSYLRERANRPKPHGALLPAARLRGKRRIVGVVTGTPSDDAPFALDKSCGWALELSCARFIGSAVMLREGATSGFALRTDDGATVTIPAGMLRLAHGGEEDAPNETMVREHVRAISHEAADTEDEEPAIPWEKARAIELRPGDRVEVIATLESADMSYRSGNDRALIATDIPSVRKVAGRRELPPPSDGGQ